MHQGSTKAKEQLLSIRTVSWSHEIWDAPAWAGSVACMQHTWVVLEQTWSALVCCGDSPGSIWQLCCMLYESPRMGEQCVSELPTFSRRPQGAGTPNAGIRAHAERVSDGLRTENLERPEGTVDQWLGCTVSPLGSSLLHSSRQPFDAKMMNQSHTGEQSYFIPCVHQVQPFG